jgi:acetolactate synthase-1/2/3 large subunit
MIKVSDYIAQYIAEQGVKHVFMVTGGAAMHLNDSLGKHPELEVIFNHHEQACAIAAESYARLTNNIAVVNVTAGPGGLNTLNGVFGAWTDSIPMLVISGQARYDTTLQGVNLPLLRQMGDQEYDIVKSVGPMTKYAVMLTEPLDIKYHLQKAFYFARQGRPGPVWLDIPLNFQGAMIDESQLREYDFPHAEKQEPEIIAAAMIQQVLAKIQVAERPVILAGTGVRLSGAYQTFLTVIDQLNIPVVTAFNAHDLLTEDHPCYAGRPGTIGDRAGNFAVQNADLLIVLGCRLNIRQIGYNWKSFARAAFKIAVDIDPVEMQKPTVKIDLPIQGDLADFLQQLSKQTQTTGDKSTWLDWCVTRRHKYPVVEAAYWERKDAINPYCFVSTLSDELPPNQIIVTGDATACITTFQALKIKPNQRLYSNSGCASMGYDLPAALGACFAAGRQSIICLAGDGSIQMNIQELATIRHYQLPIKIFLLNNNGYHSIRQTQNNYFGKPLVGVGPDSGLFFPDAEKIAAAYDMSFYRANTHADMQAAVQATLKHDKPVICEVMLTTEQPFAPKLSSKRLADGRMVSKPLEDLAPFLDKIELQENMFIELMPEE